MVAVEAVTKSVESLKRHDQNQYLTYMLGREMFALPILCIKEILEYEAPTDVPMMPPFVRGIVNLRGAVVPVIDLAQRFGRESSPTTKKTCIVIVETQVDEEAHVFGVMVDAVNEVLEIPDTEIEAAPAFGAAVRTDFIQGMGKVNGRFVIILNVQAALSVDDMTLIAGATKQ
jgi:purine-binding chemotaxis protein CheW